MNHGFALGRDFCTGVILSAQQPPATSKPQGAASLDSVEDARKNLEDNRGKPKTARAEGSAAKRQVESAKPDQISNGISVGRPKIFDNRTLTIMLENLSQTLAGVQFIDQKSVARVLGNLSGLSSKDFTSNLTVNTLPTPALRSVIPISRRMT